MTSPLNLDCLQDVKRCGLCEIPVPSKHCEICQQHLCETCVRKHESARFKEHYIVPFSMRRCTTKCSKHTKKICTFHCKDCNIPICSICLYEGKHQWHKKGDVLNILTDLKKGIQDELNELQNSIYPKYEQAASAIPFEEADKREYYQGLKTAVDIHGETLHKKIDCIIQRMKLGIDKMHAQHMRVLNQEKNELSHSMIEITAVIQNLGILLDANNVCLFSEHTSRNEEFRKLPQFQFTLPTFISQKINDQHFGCLSKLEIAYPFLDEPRLLTEIKTKFDQLRSVSCVGENELWTCGKSNIMSLYNFQGELLKSVTTKSRQIPQDIAVTRSGNLVYTDSNDRSINLVSNTDIKPLIRLRRWRPLGVCCTSTGDLLVTMNNDEKCSKVARYYGSTEKQNIQHDEQGQLLFSFKSGCIYHLCENRNFDICVVDNDAIVVVSADGHLRFTYTGHPYACTTIENFSPYGIATDSQSRILIADSESHRIHIIDQNGHFLRYIFSCGISAPSGLCVDREDNIFIAERMSCLVKKIQYYK